MRHTCFNPHNGRALRTLTLSGIPSAAIRLNQRVTLGSASGIVRAFGFVGRGFQITLETER